MDVRIRYVEKGEVKKLIQFNKRNYRAGHILTDKKYLDWQFGSFPRESKRYTILGIFNAENDLLGVLGLTFLDYQYLGKKVPCASLANLMIDKRLRNLGLGYLLMREAERIHSIAIDHGVNEDAMRLFSGRGWVEDDLQRYCFVFNSAAIKRMTNQKRLAIRDSKCGGGRQSGMELIPLKRYDARLEGLFKRTRIKYPITVCRTKQYLNWRYFQHPLIAYDIFVTVRGSAVESFVVVRLEGPKHFRAGRIIDFISLDRAEMFTLAGVLDFCRRKKANFVDCYFSSNFHVKSLKAAGFIDGSRGPYSLLPKFLNPVITTGKTNINFVIKVQETLQDKNIKNIKNWYTTKGGGDQDRAY